MRLGIGLSVSDHITRAWLIPQANLLPIDANQFWVRAPSGWGTAVAYRFERNLGTTVTSIGSPWAPWRRTGEVEIATIESDPASPLFVYSDEDGAQDYAVQRGTIFIYGGSFHGGESIVSQSLLGDGKSLNPTVPARFSAFRLERSTLITWSDATTMSVDHSVEIEPGGVVTESTSFASASAFATQYLQMEMPQALFSEIIVDGVTTTTTTGAEYTLTSGGSPAGDFTFRSPTTGHTVRVQSNAPAVAGYQRTWVSRAGVGNKLYMQKASTSGAAFGSRSCGRTITFGKEV